VRELAAHTAHTFESIRDYSSPARTAERIEIANVADFYATVVDTGPDAARERRAQELARQLTDPPAIIRQKADATLTVLDGVPDD
jgi:hypothetical protein